MLVFFYDIIFMKVLTIYFAFKLNYFINFSFIYLEISLIFKYILMKPRTFMLVRCKSGIFHVCNLKRVFRCLNKIF